MSNTKQYIQKVEPIRDLTKIEEMKSILRARSKRDWFMFYLGINTGMRISDILNLRYKDLQGTHIIIKEEKTDKIKRFVINKDLRTVIDGYSDGKNLNEFCFKQLYGSSKITRQYAHRVSKPGRTRLRNGLYRYTYNAENVWILLLQKNQRRCNAPGNIQSLRTVHHFTLYRY